jgi:hypothetical protein
MKKLVHLITDAKKLYYLFQFGIVQICTVASNKI